jgi:hypothetical protein
MIDPSPLSAFLRRLSLVALFGACLGAGPAAAQVDSSLGFFITSAGLGKGGNLGGLAGADAQCLKLAAAAGSTRTNWRAYLSTQAVGTAPAVNAKDRIGTGPWFNAKKVKVAESVADLHSPNNKLNKENSLTEAGAVVKGRGDSPNQHDILTGSHADGTAYAPGQDRTCANWTSESTGSAMLGHHDRHGVAGNIDSTSWNEAHASSGCSQSALVSTGGNGFFYCFEAGGSAGLGEAGSRLLRRGELSWADRSGSGAGPVFRFDLETSRTIEARVLGIRGEVLRVLYRGRKAAGAHEIRWDGRNSAGAIMPRGVYPVQLLSGE